ncbi:DUF4158 domain-containing protein [Streptosporangium roseum]|uniref:DUF4158 domain-containing protein n=1 Tax=Streptosporangium roseum TaxID=2001 RepID=UPI0033259DA8
MEAKRRPATKLGWAVQWGTVRMLGVFLTEDPLGVPPGAVAFVAEQLGLDPLELSGYGRRQQTVYEHAWEIRELLGYHDFGACETEVRQYVAARVWASMEGPRALFDRARVHLLKERILLPGITVLMRLVGEVRRAENERVHALLSGQLSHDMQQALENLLTVPDGKRRSELERLRTAPVKASGRVLAEELKRVSEIAALGTGRVVTDSVPAVKLGAPARYGLGAKAPTLRGLDEPRKGATLLATVRHLETASVDDALDVLDLLIATNLLARAERAGKAEQLRTFPKLRLAARTMASAVEVLTGAPEATADRLVSLVEVWKAIEEVVPREKLAAAVETVAAFVPVTDDDAAAEWRAELVKRYRTVQGFIEPLLATIRLRAVEAGGPVLAMVATAAAMAKRRRRYGPADIAAHESLVTGSWRHLVYRNPDLPAGQVDKAAFTLCADAPARRAAPA